MAESVEFNGAHLKRSVRLPPAIIQRIPLLGGVGVGLFGEFKRSSSVIGRLLVGATQFEGLRRPLSHTDAIETLIEAREAKREELRQAEAAEEAAERAAKMENKIVFKLDEASVVLNKHMKPAPLKHLPPYVTVVAPAVSGLEPLEMKVLMSDNVKAPLWLELTVPNVSYLHRLIVKQIQEGSIHNVHPRVRRGLDPVGVAGVSRIYNDPKAGSYRYSLKSIEYRHTAKLDCSVMAPGDSNLHAVVPSAASGSSNARFSTDAGLSDQEEGRRWSPKKCENSFLEELAEVEQWARANINVLRAREGDGFRSKLRQLNGSEEKRIYFLLTKHKERIAASAALAAQLANLDSIVMPPGEASLTATLPLTASGSRKARCSTDAGLNAQEEGKKRSKTEATGQIGSAGRCDPCGSAGESKSESAMSRDSMVEASVTLASRHRDTENRTKHPKTARTPARTKSRRARKSVAASNAGMPELHEDEPVEVVSPAVAQVDEAEQGHESGEESVDDGK